MIANCWPKSTHFYIAKLWTELHIVKASKAHWNPIQFSKTREGHSEEEKLTNMAARCCLTPIPVASVDAAVVPDSVRKENSFQTSHITAFPIGKKRAMPLNRFDWY